MNVFSIYRGNDNDTVIAQIQKGSCTNLNHVIVVPFITIEKGIIEFSLPM